jgi:hypothetical protein
VLRLMQALDTESPAERSARAEEVRRALYGAVTAALAEHETRIEVSCAHRLAALC